LHPALTVQDENLKVISYDGKIDLKDLFAQVEAFGADRMTIQSGGEMNSVLIRAGLIDEAFIVVAPILIGGLETPTLVDGESLRIQEDLSKVKSLELIESKVLENNYLSLHYRIKK
jgi:2,5-diamino-6-(ribosylamino)-4(3H)-pyrimidinone 5'-phosphate reductase